MRRTRLAKRQKGRNIPKRLYLALTGKLPSFMRSAKTGKEILLETSRKTPRKEQYIDFVLSKPLRRYRKESVSEVVQEIKKVNPRAKITLLPQPTKLAWFQDVRVSNISAGQALELQGILGAHGLFLKA